MNTSLSAQEVLKAKQLRFIATLRHVWRLNEEEKSFLNRYFRIKATAEQLSIKLDGFYNNDLTATSDHIYHNEELYKVEYIDTSMYEIDEIVELHHRCNGPAFPANCLFIISCRIHKPTNTFISLIRKAKEHEKCDKTPWIDTPVSEQQHEDEDHSDD